MVAFIVYLIAMVAVTVAIDLLSPKPDIEDAKPAGLGGFRFPTATEDRAVPLLFGTVRVEAPNVIWYDDYEQVAITEEITTGLFTSEEFIKGFRYRIGFQLGFCEGPVDACLRLWSGKDDVIATGTFTHGDTISVNLPDLYGGDELGDGGLIGDFEFFSGTGTQAASTYLSTFQSFGGTTPAYRNVCYIAPLTTNVYVGNSASVRQISAELQYLPDNLSLTGSNHIVNTTDANPAEVLYLVLTARWGKRIPASSITTASFTTAGNTLFAEGQGFSMIVDVPEDPNELISRIEEQIDGLVYQNPTDGKWEIALMRADYDVDLIDEINTTNLVSVKAYNRGTWEGIKNQVRVPFFDAADDYRASSGFASDAGAIRIIGKTVPTEKRHPGVKSAALANKLAWRELRGLSRPTDSCEVTVTREFYGVKPGDPLAWTSADLNMTRQPFRVIEADYGNILNGEITLLLVQDVFKNAAGSFANPPATNWEQPSDTLVAFPAAQQRAFEAPRALTSRSVHETLSDRIYFMARRQGPEAQIVVRERNAAGTPSGAYADAGNAFGFCRIGQLVGTLSSGSAVPQTSITIDATPDTQAALESLFPDITDIVGLGTNLTTLILVDDEFMLVTSAEDSGGDVQLNSVYRGVLDSVQADHSSAADVFVVFAGAGISSATITPGNNVEVILLPKSTTDELAEGSATSISFLMDNRVRRPYPPSAISLNGTRYDASVSLEGGTGTVEDIGIDVSFVRRSINTADEIDALSTDAATLDASFPTEFSTTHEAEVIDDPSGSPTTLYTEDFASASSGSLRRLDILQNNSGVLPTTLGVKLRASHTFDGTAYDSLFDLEWEWTLSSALTGQFAFGALDTNDISNSFTVDDDTQDHAFTLSTSFSAGLVESRINGGGWSTLISAASTSGSILAASLTNGDTIEIRHTSTDTGAQKLITMSDGSAAAFGVLYV